MGDNARGIHEIPLMVGKRIPLATQEGNESILMLPAVTAKFKYV